MANEEHLQRLKQGVDTWNAWKQAHPEISIDLSGADFHGIDFHGADFHGARLRAADFYGADLRACLKSLRGLCRMEI